LITSTLAGVVSQMSVAMFPGWFHPGALTPDLDKVDVRTSVYLL
jgi:hypothetical protein